MADNDQSSGLTPSREESSCDLEAAREELDALYYAISHDLRAPLRAVDGFSQALEEDWGDRLDESGRNYLTRIRKANRTLGQMVEGLLGLSRLSRAEIRLQSISLSELAEEIISQLNQSEPGRRVECVIAPALMVCGDARLLSLALDHLLRNAWKFTRRQALARIEVGAREDPGGPVFYVRDNGVGFDLQQAGRLFAPFQRLHAAEEFEGLGLGLAAVRRIVARHGGRIHAEALIDHGATFLFTLPGEKRKDS
jgi:light-regulated signal transduction histidine kinase (bacteriophytochrome)